MEEQHPIYGISFQSLIFTRVAKPKLSENCATDHNRYLRRIASIALGLMVLMIFSGCGKDPALKTDAELGLNAQQAQGRRVFQLYCGVCHSAYNSKPLKGPSLKGMFQKEYLPSGLVANDRFVEQTILRGRNMMPPMGNSLTQQQVEDVLAYLHTL